MHDLSEAKAIAPAEIRMPSLLAARAYLFSALGCLFRKFVERCARAQGHAPFLATLPLSMVRLVSMPAALAHGASDLGT